MKEEPNYLHRNLASWLIYMVEFYSSDRKNSVLNIDLPIFCLVANLYRVVVALVSLNIDKYITLWETAILFLTLLEAVR